MIEIQKQNAPILGEICFWTLADISITRDELENLFNKYGLDKKYLPPVVSDKKAFSRALKDLEKKEKEKMVRKIADNEDIIAYCIVDEIADQNNIDVDYELVDAIIFNKKEQNIKLKLNKVDYKWIEENFEYFKTIYTVDDIRAMIVKVLKSINSILIRKHGGVYFVPKNSISELNKLKNIINEIGSSKFYTLAIYDIEETKKTAIKLFKEDFLSELKESAEHVIELINKDAHSRYIQNSIEKFKKSIEKLSMFKTLLQFEAEDIEEIIKSYQEKISKNLLSSIA